MTYKKRFSFDPPIGSRLCTWLISTASARASITNSRTISRGKRGEYRASMVGIGSLETPLATTIGTFGIGELDRSNDYEGAKVDGRRVMHITPQQRR